MNKTFTVSIAFLIFSLLSGCGNQQEQKKEVIRPVRAIKLSDASILIDDVYPGRAKAVQEVDFSFRVSGPMVELPVDIGDKVKTGDLLGRLDPRDFKVALDNVKGQLSRARAAYARANRDYNRFLEIQKENVGYISQSRVDMARAVRDEANANVRSLLATVKSADDRLRYTHLKATFSGTVVAKYVEKDEFVNARVPVIRVLDSSQIEMIANVPESKISLVQYVTAINVRFDAFPERDIVAKIKEVGTEASRTTRTYPVTLIMEQPTDFKILPGMAGKAYPQLSQAADSGSEITLTIPVTAVFSPTPDDKSYVWIVNEDSMTISRREVTLGYLGNQGILVKAGVKAGEWVVTAGVSFLHEGQKIKLLQEGS